MKSIFLLTAVSVLSFFSPPNLSAQATSLGSSTIKPATDQTFMQARRQDLIGSLHVQPAGTTTDVEVQARRILQALPYEWPRTPDLWVCRGCGTSSHPDLGIILDLTQISQIRQQERPDDFPQMLTFIVAHEAGHQLQFARYGHDLWKQPSPVRQYYEAQADILAGMCLYSLLTNKLDPANAGSLDSALRPVYDLGAEEYALADHPSKSGRFLAARFGYISAYSSHLDPTIEQQQIARFRQQLDFRSGDDNLTFSLRAARRIVQYNAIATKDLVLLSNERRITFDKSSSHPTVNYRLVYQNRGGKKLNVTLRFACTSILRADPDNIFGSVDDSAEYQTFSISPGEKRTLTGQLTWSADKDRYPYFVEPPDPLGLIQVEYSDGTEPPPNSLSTGSGSLGLDDATVAARNNLISILNTYVRASLTGFSGLRGGPGETSDDSTDFPSNRPFPGSIRNEVSFPTLQSGETDLYIRSTLIRTLASSVAAERFAATVALIRAALPNVAVPGDSAGWKERNTTKNPSEPNLLWSQGDYFISIRQFKNERHTGLDNIPTYFVVDVLFHSPAPQSGH